MKLKLNSFLRKEFINFFVKYKKLKNIQIKKKYNNI